MSDSSQFFASFTDAISRTRIKVHHPSMNAFFLQVSHSTIVKASVYATRSVADRLQTPVGEAAQRQSILCKGFGSDADGALTNAYLFIRSPHSCEVVKTRYFTLFWRRESQPQKGLHAGSSVRFGHAIEALERAKGSKAFEPVSAANTQICVHKTCVGGSLWALRRR